jgi:geranylgeranyl pyrophosphate synthase
VYQNQDQARRRQAGGGRRVAPATGEDVEAALIAELDRLPAPLAGPCRRVGAAGGKRLRPRLVLAAAAATGRAGGRRLVDAAVTVELLHLATLVHDDLLDDAASRRGVPTINAVEGPATALLAGDLLIGAAGRLAASVGAEAAGLVQQALMDLATGQAVEELSRYDAGVTREQALEVAAGKTGTLLRTACQLGALASPDVSADLLEALGDFGMAFGTCLQLLDDVLDLVSSSALYGKPTGVDFASGTVSLPAVAALERSEELRNLLRPGLTELERQQALTLLRAGGGVAEALHCAFDHAGRAQRTLTGVQDAGEPQAIARLAPMPWDLITGQLALVLPRHQHLLGLSAGLPRFAGTPGSSAAPLPPLSGLERLLAAPGIGHSTIV